MKTVNTISIKCESNETKNIAELTELQGKLKHREDIDYDKIKLSIIKYGFSFPFFYTELNGKNYILDGHGRYETLCRMQKDGYIIPDLPCVKVECKDIEEAKQKLLRLNSTYGKLSRESVLEFVGDDFELNTDEIALPDTTLSFDSVEEDKETDSEEEGLDLAEKYEVIVTCEDSAQQEEIFYQLTEQGLNVRVSTM